MGDFDSLLECRIGGNPLAGFTATDYTYTAEPQVRDGIGRTGTAWSLTVEGYLSGADEAELAARQRALEAAVAVGNQDVVLLGLGGVESVRLLASLAVDGGPHVAVEIGTGAGALKRSVTLTGEGVLGLAEDWEVPPARYTETTSRDVSDRPTVRRRGSVSAKAGRTARQVFDEVVVPAFERDYPRRTAAGGGPGWVVSQEYEEDAAGRTGTYTLEAVRLASEIAGSDAANYALDGTASTSEERDEQGRRVKTLSFDLVVEGDPRAVYEQLRALAAAPEGQVGQIVRERIEVTDGRERRLRGAFSVLIGDAGSTRLDWSQQLEVEGEDNELAAKSYPAIGPVIYALPRRAVTAVQSGRAVGLDAYPTPPGPVLPASALSEPRRVTYRRLSEHELEVSWRYSYLFASAPAVTPEVLRALATPPQAEGSGGAGGGQA